MAELIYYDTDVQAIADLYDILKAIPNFWDSYDDETSALTKGGITLALGETKSISGYGMSLALTLASNTVGIAATEKGLIVHTGTAIQSTGIFAIGCDKEGNWAGAAGSNSSPRISFIVADGVSSTNYMSNTDVNSSNTMTQIIDLATDKGNFIFDDVRRVLMCPVTSYNGKLTMPNGEKYVKRGGFALRYT